MIERCVKLATGSVVSLYAVGCVALTNPDAVQAFLLDTVVDWMTFAAQAGSMLGAL